MISNAKKILIETETTETFRLRITGPQTMRSYCPECGRIEEMLDLNSAADASGSAARELLGLIAASVLHSPETARGHLLICRGSLEEAINDDSRLRIGRNHSIRTYCESCGADDDMIDLNAAVTATGIPASDLIARIAEGSIHSPKTTTGHLLVCLGSLKHQPDREQTL